MKKVKFSRDEKRKIVNYIQELLGIKILSPKRHTTKECDEDIIKIFRECDKGDFIFTKEKNRGEENMENLEKLVFYKNMENDILNKENLKLSNENNKLKNKLKRKSLFDLF